MTREEEDRIERLLAEIEERLGEFAAEAGKEGAADAPAEEGG